jgi:hypothetical protein
MPVRAEDTWQLDPQHSVARLSLGSGSNAVGIGSARVSGDVVFESSDPADPFVRLKITPSNGANCRACRDDLNIGAVRSASVRWLSPYEDLVPTCHCLSQKRINDDGIHSKI